MVNRVTGLVSIANGALARQFELNGTAFPAAFQATFQRHQTATSATTPLALTTEFNTGYNKAVHKSDAIRLTGIQCRERLGALLKS